MSSLRPLGLALAVLLAAGAAWGDTPWTKYEDNPVLEAGEPGEWDQGGVVSGAVLFDGATYHLWYAGARTQWPDTDIGYATSPDGVTWTKYPGNPVLVRQGTWDSGGIFPGAVVWDGGTYHMWFVNNSGSVTQTGYATSPDGVTWMPWPDPVLTPGGPGSWDEDNAHIHAVLAEGGIYHAWYNGSPASASWQAIGYATSPDGVTWTKHPDPVLSPAGTGWDFYTVTNPEVVFDGTYHMWYSGRGSRFQIGHAASSDGIHWVRQPADEPVLPTGGAGAWDSGGLDVPQVLLVGDTAHMWYTGWIGALQSVAIGYATAQLPLPASCPKSVGRWPYGPAYAVAVSGNHVYFGGGTALMVADVSDPAAPQVVGEVVLPDFAQMIALEGGYAYVADGGTPLLIIDVSVPSNPVEVGSLDTPGLVARDVAVSGGYAYLAAGYSGLRVIDVSTPSNPVEIGFVDTPGWATGVAVAGGYAYVADISGGLRVVDVTTPTAPVEVGFVDAPGNARGVVVLGGYAYVADGPGGLSVIDVSTPTAPVEVGYVNTPGTSWGVTLSGGYAYLADMGGGLRVIDISSPAAPVEVGFLDTPGTAYGVAVSGVQAYVADSNSGLRVIDVSTPSAPVEVGSLKLPVGAGGIAVSGGYGYMGVFVDDDPDLARTGLRVLNVSDPATPAEVGFVDTPGWARAVVVSGGYAYVASDEAGLRVIDISSPATPAEVGFVDTPGRAYDVAVSRGFAYVADRNQGLRVINISTPSAPVEVGFLDTPGLAAGIAVSGGYAYVADNIALRVIDISTPSSPVEVGFINAPGLELDVAVSGRYAYLASGVMGLRIIDVSEPSAPVEVGIFDPPGTAQVSSVAVARGFAYISELDGNAASTDSPHFVRVVDVSTPSAPVEVGYAETVAWLATDVSLSDGHVFVTGGDAGMYVFSDCAGDTVPDGRECFIPAAAVAAGAEGAFFSTDVELNNTGAEEAEVTLQWLPRGEDNPEPVSSGLFTLAPGASLRFDNVLTEVFGLEPDSLGALKMVASTDSVIGMSRTYNSPGGKAAGTFGQELPAVRATEMISGTEPQRIVFLSENDDSRANVGCVNGSNGPLSINIGIFDDEGLLLETTTMDLGPWSNDQINRVFEDYAPVNGYVDVWGDGEDALFTCYGSMLDNLTSDPTTILPQVPSDDTTFIPAAALAAGLEGAFFTTDVDLNNVGSDDITYEFLWLPRGADNTDPVRSDTFSLAAGSGVRYANVLGEVFGLGPDQVGALAIEASGIDLLAMSRTYNTPPATGTGTFGQGLPGVPADRMIPTGVRKRIVFMSEDDDFRANLGCVNGAAAEVVVVVDLHDSDGAKLETRYMVLPPYSNWQFNGIFQNYAPVNGYVEVRTNTPDAAFTCYGSVLDNLTSDPTTVLPQ